MTREQQLAQRVRSNETRCNAKGLYPRPLNTGPSLIPTIAKTMQSLEVQNWFWKCKRAGLLDCTREATVLDFEDLFHPLTVAWADMRLKVIAQAA